MVYAIEPPGLPFNFRFQKGLRVNPYMDRLSVLQGQFELIGVAVLNFFHVRQLDLRALGRVIDRGPSRSGCRDAAFISSVVKGSTTRRLRNGLSFQPLAPSNTCTAVWPLNCSSNRILRGRFSSITNGS